MIYPDLIFNLTLLITFSMFSGFMENRWSRHTRPGLIFQGILFGGAVVLGMMWPVNLGEGLIFDGRTIMVSLCAMFFGPVSAAIAAVMAVAFRIWLGGVGMYVGSFVVLSSACIGLVAYYHLKPQVDPPTPGIIYLYGLAVHAVMFLSMLYVPGGSGLGIIRHLILPVIILYPLALMLVGMMLSHQIRARHAFDVLKSNEERYRQLFESSNDAIFISQLSGEDAGIFVEVNDVACKRLGYSREELLKMSPADIDCKDMEENRKRAIGVLAETGHTVFEMTQIDKSGNEIPEEISSRVFEQEGKKYVLSIARDVRENRRAVNELKKSEEKYRNFFMTSRDCVFITSSNGRWIDFNDAALELFGSPSREELMKIPIPELYENPQERKAFLDLIVSKGYVREHPFRLRKKDGTVIDTIITATKITGEGDTDTVFVGTIRDITENKKMEEALLESEQKFRMLSDQSLMAIGLIQDGLFKYVNQAYCNIIGYSLEEVMKWKPYENAKMVHPDDREYVMDQVERKQSGRPDFIEHYQFKGLTKHGETKWLDVYSKTVLHDGRPADLAAFIDITERVLAEEEIRKLNSDLELRVLQRTAQLESLNKDLESFSYSVSHDLRAPLRAISGFASIIARRHRSSLNEEAQHYFDNIVQASERMGHLIDDLLQYSRLGRGGVRSEQVHLRDVFGPLESDLADTIVKKGGTLKIDEDLPFVMGDRTLLGQIFANLLENAVTYSKPDIPAQVRVSCNVENRDVIVCVSDNGIGIPPEYHEKIFNIFQRLHSDDEYPGTGIGLSTVKKSVELLHGRIWVESEPGLGSRFFVKLKGAYHE